MKQIGTQIRGLRKKRRMTQEQLAALLGVSAQSVSKWENCLTAPDISLLPVLAGIFQISIDELFDYNQRETEQAVMEICRASWEHRESDRLKSREILREGLQRFPSSAVLLNNYLYTLDFETENEEIIRAATSLAEAVEGDPRSDDVRYDALRFLAGAYARTGEHEFAKATLEQIPEIYFTKLSAAAEILRGKDKFEAASQQKWICLEMLVDMMRELAVFYESEGQSQKALEEKEKARELIRLFSHGREDWVEKLLIEVE